MADEPTNLIERSFFVPTDYRTPISVIGNLGSEHDYLADTTDQALNHNWGEYSANCSDTCGSGGVEPIEPSHTTRDPVDGEELVAMKRSREIGDVQIAKDVNDEERTIDVSVTEEGPRHALCRSTATPRRTSLPLKR